MDKLTSGQRTLCDVAESLYELIPAELLEDRNVFAIKFNLENGFRQKRLGLTPKFDLYGLARLVLAAAYAPSSAPKLEELGGLAKDLINSDPIASDCLKAAMVFEKYLLDCPEAEKDTTLQTAVLRVRNELRSYSLIRKKPQLDDRCAAKLKEVIGHYVDRPETPLPQLVAKN